MVAVELSLDGHEGWIGVDQLVEAAEVVVDAEVDLDAAHERGDVGLAQGIVGVELVAQLRLLHGAGRGELEGDRRLAGPGRARERLLRDHLLAVHGRERHDEVDRLIEIEGGDRSYRAFAPQSGHASPAHLG